MLADEMCVNDTTNFWRHVKEGIRPASFVRSPQVIGGASSHKAVPSLWKEHFSAIINSESVGNLERDKFLFDESLKSNASPSKWPWWSTEITPLDVEKALSRLKLNKSGPDGITTEHLRFGGYELSIHLSVAFTACLRHAFVPRQFLNSVIVLIAKDRHGDVGNPDNYRGIAISSVVSKASEHVILIKWGVYLSTSAQQFGFKRDLSCSDCSFVLKETIDYYVTNGNKVVHTCAMD